MYFCRKTKASYFITETLLVEKVAYIHAVFLGIEWKNMSYKLEKKFDYFFHLFAKLIKYEKHIEILFTLKCSL